MKSDKTIALAERYLYLQDTVICHSSVRQFVEAWEAKRHHELDATTKRRHTSGRFESDAKHRGGRNRGLDKIDRMVNAEPEYQMSS